MDPDTYEAYEERAAIREFDGGQTREEAEAGARADIGIPQHTPEYLFLSVVEAVGENEWVATGTVEKRLLCFNWSLRDTCRTGFLLQEAASMHLVNEKAPISDVWRRTPAGTAWCLSQRAKLAQAKPKTKGKSQRSMF